MTLSISKRYRRTIHLIEPNYVNTLCVKKIYISLKLKIQRIRSRLTYAYYETR